jgi:cytochrome c-type biogenesis protein CcmF
MVLCASFLLMSAFLTHDYNNKYVAHYSDNNMPWYYLIASFWGGQAGSLMFWSMILAVGTGIVIWQN